jgi:hypothetical protein
MLHKLSSNDILEKHCVTLCGRTVVVIVLNIKKLKGVHNMDKIGVKKLTWQNLALMAFVMVWGFGNVVNNFANQGLQVVGSWVLII